MNPRDIRVRPDDDPTVEEEAPDFDASRTDQIERPSFASPQDHSSGTVEHDERGQARWKWSTEHAGLSSETDQTFNELEALTNDLLSLEEPSGAERTPGPKSGYNPYDTNAPQAPKPPRKTPAKR